MKNIHEVISYYRQKKSAIKTRLKAFENLHRRKPEEIFKELCFCLLTPQSKAVSCHRALTELDKKGLLLKGKRSDIEPHLKGMARFHSKKAAYIVGARSLLHKGRAPIFGRKLGALPVKAARDWLVQNIKGLGYKEASHFLRNIGLGSDIAILDRHILKNLKRYGAIDRIPDSIGTRKRYLDIEDKARRFCKSIRIPLEEIDLLFWSRETGYIFK